MLYHIALYSDKDVIIPGFNVCLLPPLPNLNASLDYGYQLDTYYLNYAIPDSARTCR